jgi:uncharacterized protein
MRGYLMLAFLVCAAAGAQEKVVGSLPGPQVWKNRPADWKAEGGRLTIAAGKSTDWFISPVDGERTASAPLLLFEPAREFTLTAKVTAKHGTKWDAGVLMVFVDDSTWAKLALERSAYQEPTVVSVVTRGVSDDCNSTVVSGDMVWFRVSRLKNAIGFFSSPDGRKWKMVRAFTLGEARGLKVGFGTQSPVGPGTTAVFSEITYRTEPVKDFYAAE